jgi:hypothetical protein
VNEGFDIIAEAEQIVRRIPPRQIAVHYAKEDACVICGEAWPCQVARDVLHY